MVLSGIWESIHKNEVDPVESIICKIRICICRIRLHKKYATLIHDMLILLKINKLLL